MNDDFLHSPLHTIPIRLNNQINSISRMIKPPINNINVIICVKSAEILSRDSCQLICEWKPVNWRLLNYNAHWGIPRVNEEDCSPKMKPIMVSTVTCACVFEFGSWREIRCACNTIIAPISQYPYCWFTVSHIEEPKDWFAGRTTDRVGVGYEVVAGIGFSPLC